MALLFSVLRTTRLLAVLALWPILGTHAIQVVDQDGNAVDGAKVTPVTLSVNGAARATDANGRADVPFRIALQETRWIEVTKEGYEGQYLDVAQSWPTKVMLRRDSP